MPHPSNSTARAAHHQTFFVRNLRSGEFKAACTCGWHGEFLNLNEAHSAAAIHDLREENGYSLEETFD